MTSKVSVGVARKIGQPNFGSVSASCQVELQLDDGPTDDQEQRLTAQIRHAYAICRREVEQELARTASSSLAITASGPDRNGSGNGTQSSPLSPRPRSRPATDAQIRAIHAIASKANVRLASELDSEFGVTTPGHLTLRQASELIEKLKRQLPTG